LAYAFAGPSPPIEQWQKTAYSKDRSAYNRAQAVQLDYAPVVLAQACNTLREKKFPYVTGRPPYPVHTMIFEAALRCMEKLPLRQSISVINRHIPDMLSEQRSRGHYSTLSNHLRRKEITPLLRELIVTTSLPLSRHAKYFAIDATGFSGTEKKPWAEVVRGDEIKMIDHSIWQKLHICIDIDTKIVTDAIVTFGKDNENFRKMLETTSKNFEVKEVYADKYYCTRENHDFASRLGIEPFIPFKKNATGKPKGSFAWKAAFKLFKENPDQFYSHYNARSSAETVMSMLKANFASTLRSRNHVAQVNEVLLKVICHNIYTLCKLRLQLGLDIDLRPLSERQISQISEVDPLALKETTVEIPQKSVDVVVVEKIEDRSDHKSGLIRRKCSECQSARTAVSKKGTPLWHHWNHGKEWYCHRCFHRKDKRKRRGIRKAKWRIR
jgi:transposase